MVFSFSTSFSEIPFYLTEFWHKSKAYIETTLQTCQLSLLNAFHMHRFCVETTFSIKQFSGRRKYCHKYILNNYLKICHYKSKRVCVLKVADHQKLFLLKMLHNRHMMGGWGINIVGW